MASGSACKVILRGLPATVLPRLGTGDAYTPPTRTAHRPRPARSWACRGRWPGRPTGRQAQPRRRRLWRRRHGFPRPRLSRSARTPTAGATGAPPAPARSAVLYHRGRHHASRGCHQPASHLAGPHRRPARPARGVLLHRRPPHAAPPPSASGSWSKCRRAPGGVSSWLRSGTGRPTLLAEALMRTLWLFAHRLRQGGAATGSGRRAGRVG